jgi:hypothetical protein
MRMPLFFLMLLLCDYRSLSAQDKPGASVKPFYGYSQAIELSNGKVRVIISPESGGRILEYSLNGRNALYLSEDEKSWTPGKPPQASAGRFDIGPELVIPPRKVLWGSDWKGEIVGERHVRVTSPDDPSTGTRLTRDFVLDATASKLLCTQTIHNISDRTTEWCHWSRTFAVGKGICLIPLTSPSRFPNRYVMYEEGSLINMRPEDPAIRERDGFLEILKAPRKPKLGFDSYAGVIAYRAPNDLLFVKRFPTYPDRVYNEAAGLTISVWYPDNAMVELEPIGPRERLKPGESGSFTEEWWLAELPFPKSGEADLSALQSALDRLK